MNESLQPIEKLSASDYAKKRNISRMAVSKAIKEGRITAVKDENGRVWIDPKKADLEWKQNTGNKKTRNIELLKDDIEHLKTITKHKKEKMSYAEARGYRENFLALTAELKYLETQGELVDINQVKSNASKIGITLKDILASLPERIATTVITMDNIRDITTFIKNELNQSLNDIINELSNQ